MHPALRKTTLSDTWKFVFYNTSQTYLAWNKFAKKDLELIEKLKNFYESLEAEGNLDE